MLVVFSYGVYLIAEYHKNPDDFVEHIKDSLNYSDRYSFITLIYLVTIETAIGAIIDGSLITLHIWLRCQKMTTFEYIIKKRNKRKDKIKVSAEKDMGTGAIYDETTISYIEKSKIGSRSNKKIVVPENEYTTNEGNQTDGIVTVNTDR